jgi:Zn finger protein HypA/HybF involved in hydrogenase expression
MMCPEQHLYCKNCIDIQFSNPNSTEKRLYSVCPECRSEVPRENVKEFRLYKLVLRTYNKLKNAQEEERISRDY